MNHLPECFSSDSTQGTLLVYCICDRLRACEQRVIVKTIRTLDIAGTDDRAYVKGHAAGVQAARAAVAAVSNVVDVFGSTYVNRVDALAAIDALAVDRD